MKINSKTLLSISHAIVGFPVHQIDYVWAETFNDDGTTKKMGKTHISTISKIGTPERYRTFCGIEDRCGFWGFSGVENMDSKDFCKKCKKTVTKALAAQPQKGQDNDADSTQTG